METNFEKIREILAHSSVSEDDQRMFMQSCAGVVDENLELLVDLFTENTEWIEKSVENFKEKSEATRNRDTQKWKDIIAREVSMLEDVNEMEKLRTNLSQTV